jgi:hypothetical protein
VDKGIEWAIKGQTNNPPHISEDVNNKEGIINVADKLLLEHDNSR